MYGGRLTTEGRDYARDLDVGDRGRSARGGGGGLRLKRRKFSGTGRRVILGGPVKCLSSRQHNRVA